MNDGYYLLTQSFVISLFTDQGGRYYCYYDVDGIIITAILGRIDTCKMSI